MFSPFGGEDAGENRHNHHRKDDNIVQDLVAGCAKQKPTHGKPNRISALLNSFEELDLWDPWHLGNESQLQKSNPRQLYKSPCRDPLRSLCNFRAAPSLARDSGVGDSVRTRLEVTAGGRDVSPSEGFPGTAGDSTSETIGKMKKSENEGGVDRAAVAASLAPRRQWAPTYCENTCTCFLGALREVNKRQHEAPRDRAASDGHT
jgi:hypothetical protein